MSKIDIYHWLEKAYVWARTRISGHHVEDQATKEAEQFRTQAVAEFKKVLQPEIAAIVAADGTIAESAVAALIIPKLDALSVSAIERVTLPSGIDPALVAMTKKQLETYVVGHAPDLVAELYALVAGKG